MPTLKLWPTTPSYFGPAPSPVVWSDDPPEPERWLQFLEEIFPDDPQARDTFQEAFGYSTSSDTRQQKIFALHGQPRSGRGTLLRVMTAIIGSQNITDPGLSSLGERFGLESFIGKGVAIIGDARLDSCSKAAAITQALLRISGEDRMDVERNYRSERNG